MSAVQLCKVVINGHPVWVTADEYELLRAEGPTDVIVQRIQDRLNRERKAA